MKTQLFTLSFAIFMVTTGIISLNKALGSSAEGSQPIHSIVINANDQMRFDKNEIRVKAGEKVRITLNHTGKYAKNVMGHNFVLLTKGTDIAKFATAAMSAKENNYIPSSGYIAHTKVIGGGESTTIEFTAPQKGTYDFICSFPGHYTMMKGKFIVE